MEMTTPDKKPAHDKSKGARAAKKPIKKGAQNGKGDSPRNLSASFRDNYSKINWSKKA